MDLGTRPRPSQPTALGASYGATPDGQPRVVITIDQIRVELEPNAARAFAAVLVSHAEGAEQIALLVAIARERWGVQLAIPDALAIVDAWRKRMVSPISAATLVAPTELRA